jgi:endonuclease III
MATATSKQSIVNQLVTSFPSATEETNSPLPLLEQFIYGLCRENATPEQAQQAYSRLTNSFFDWNEVRVSSVRELEEAMQGLSDTESRAHRILSFLQEVFETEFRFVLDLGGKKGAGKQIGKALSRYGAANDFVTAWVTQRSLATHAIPVDNVSLRVVQRLGLIDASIDDPETARSSLENLIPKSKGQAFTDALSVLADQICTEIDPKCSRCPLANNCPTGQEMRGERPARPSKSRAR